MLSTWLSFLLLLLRLLCFFQCNGNNASELVLAENIYSFEEIIPIFVATAGLTDSHRRQLRMMEIWEQNEYLDGHGALYDPNGTMQNDIDATYNQNSSDLQLSHAESAQKQITTDRDTSETIAFFGAKTLDKLSVAESLKISPGHKVLSFSLRQKVEGNWKDLGTWYHGKIVKVHGDDSYDVKYVGGDFESYVPAIRLRCNGVCISTSSRPSAQPSQEPTTAHQSPPIGVSTNLPSTFTQDSTFNFSDFIEMSPSGITPEEREVQVYREPPGLINQDKQDRKYLRFNRCRDAGEAYAAAYLTTKEHLLEQFTGYNLTWVNCEMGSFIMMETKKENGSIVQALDVLDFSVVHLSAYERLKRRWRKLLPDFIDNKSRNKRDWDTGSIAETVKVTKVLKRRAEILRDLDTPLPTPGNITLNSASLAAVRMRMADLYFV